MSNELPMISLFEEGLALETTPVLSSPDAGNKSFPTLVRFIYACFGIELNKMQTHCAWSQTQSSLFSESGCGTHWQPELEDS